MLILQYKTGTAGGQSSVMIRTLGDAGQQIASVTTADSSGNYYVAGYQDNLTIVAKYNSSNVLQWQRELSNAAAFMINNIDMALDSFERPVITFGYAATTFPFSEITSVILNSSDGTVVSQRALGVSGADDEGEAISVDPSGNMFVFGHSSEQGVIAKYSSSHVLLWKEVFDQTGSTIRACAIDSVGHGYAVGDYYNPNMETNIVRFDGTNGNFFWQRQLEGSGTNDNAAGAATDGTNVYVLIHSNTPGIGSADGVVAKISDTGNLLWQRNFGTIDSEINLHLRYHSGSVYAVGYNNSNKGFILKWSDTGVLQWQRTLSSTGIEQLVDVTFDTSGDLILLGNTSVVDGSGFRDFLIARFPSDGSSTGTYGAWTWSVGTFTETAGTLSFNTGTPFGTTFDSLTDSAGTWSEQAASLTDTQQV